MKILVTGNTPQQCGRGTQMKYGPVIDLFVKALRDAGIEVDHRILKPETSLTEYDAIWLGMSPINSMSSRYMYAPLEMYGRIVDEGKPCLFWIDDWQTQLLNAAFKSILKDPMRLIKAPGATLQDTRYAIDWARAPGNIDKIAKGIEYLYTKPWPKTVAPFYTWGDHLKIFEKHPQVDETNLVRIDPSRYVDWYPIQPAEDINRRYAWVCGILSDQRKWLDDLGVKIEPYTDDEISALESGDADAVARYRWEIFHTGGKASKASVRLKEPELIQQYSESWGVLSPPYWHVGSGWWRNRFVYAAYAGSIVAGDPREGAPCDPSYTYPVQMIEQFSNAQLRALADQQKTALGSQMMTKELVQEMLVETFKAVM